MTVEKRLQSNICWQYVLLLGAAPAILCGLRWSHPEFLAVCSAAVAVTYQSSVMGVVRPRILADLSLLLVFSFHDVHTM